MKSYKITINLEWTSKCNARCIMCPQDEIQNPQLMKQSTFGTVLERLSGENIYRVVIAGYGEPTSHPKFMVFVDQLRHHPMRFDMVSNGQLLDEQKLRHLDGVMDTLVISFSSIEPSVYNAVHINLDQEQVKHHILQAQHILKQTTLAISLTPLSVCLDSLEDTIGWFKRHGIHNLTMSPTLYNRGGNLIEQDTATQRLRTIIDIHQLHSQEFDFIPGIKDIALHYLKNHFRCIPRNVDLFITSGGEYLYCYNDISHRHTMGSIEELTIEEVLSRREKMDPIPSLCDGCNMRNRYGFAEDCKVAVHYFRENTIRKPLDPPSAA